MRRTHHTPHHTPHHTYSVHSETRNPMHVSVLEFFTNLKTKQTKDDTFTERLCEARNSDVTDNAFIQAYKNENKYLDYYYYVDDKDRIKNTHTITIFYDNDKITFIQIFYWKSGKKIIAYNKDNTNLTGNLVDAFNSSATNENFNAIIQFVLTMPPNQTAGYVRKTKKRKSTSVKRKSKTMKNKRKRSFSKNKK